MRRPDARPYTPLQKEAVDPRLREALSTGDLATVDSVLTDVISSARMGSVSESVTDFYRRIAEQLPGRIPEGIQQQAMRASHDADSAVADQGRRIFTLLSMKSILSAATLYEGHAKSDLDDMVQAGVGAVYANVHRIREDSAPSTMVHLRTQRAVAEYISERDGIPARTVLDKTAPEIAARTDEALKQHPYGATREERDALGAEIAEDVNTRRIGIQTYVNKRFAEQPQVVDEDEHTMAPDVVDVVVEQQGPDITEHVLKLLPEKEATVVRLRLGLTEDEEPMSSEAIGEDMDLSSTQVSRIHNDAINALGDPAVQEYATGVMVEGTTGVHKDYAEENNIRREQRDARYKDKITKAMGREQTPSRVALASELGVTVSKLHLLLEEMGAGEAFPVERRVHSDHERVVARDSDILQLIGSERGGSRITYNEIIAELQDRYPEINISFISHALRRQREATGEQPNSTTKGRPPEPHTRARREAIQQLLGRGVTDRNAIRVALRDEFDIHTDNFTVKVEVGKLTGEEHTPEPKHSTRTRREQVEMILNRAGDVPTMDDIADEVGASARTIAYDLKQMGVSMRELRKQRDGQTSKLRTPTIEVSADVTQATEDHSEAVPADEAITSKYFRGESAVEDPPNEVELYSKYGLDQPTNDKPSVQAPQVTPEIEE